jgi:hypothetical protein
MVHVELETDMEKSRERKGSEKSEEYGNAVKRKRGT